MPGSATLGIPQASILSYDQTNAATKTCAGTMVLLVPYGTTVAYCGTGTYGNIPQYFLSTYIYRDLRDLRLRSFKPGPCVMNQRVHAINRMMP